MPTDKKEPTIKYINGKLIVEDSDKFHALIENNHLSTENNIVLLTKDNAEKVERLFQQDDDYFPFSRKLFDHYGLDKVKTDEDRALFAVARELDRDNSTNVWRYKRNPESFYNMVSYIKENKNFFDRLEQGDPTLPDEIVTNCGPGLKSLSSKICKYLCEFAFPEKDHYYINDSYVRRMMLPYLDHYLVEHPDIGSSYAVDKMTYKELYKWLTKLHKARDEKYNDHITKTQLDCILWYCYKSFRL